MKSHSLASGASGGLTLPIHNGLDYDSMPTYLHVGHIQVVVLFDHVALSLLSCMLTAFSSCDTQLLTTADFF